MARLSPQNGNELVQLLNFSISNDESTRQAALSTIQKWECLSGYCSLLHVFCFFSLFFFHKFTCNQKAIIQDKSVNPDTRFVAISCFKNAINKHWSKRDGGYV